MEKLILASTSPRRIEILKDEFEIETVKPQIEEKIGFVEDPISNCISLAFEKAASVAEDYTNETILSADTIVVLDDKVLGKPKDREDAFKTLKSLSGREHRVITAFAIINLDRKIKYTDYVSSSVTFKDLSDSDIDEYLNTGEYVDKAGSYGIQGIGKVLVSHYEGSFLNIVGLPLEEVKSVIKKIDEGRLNGI